MSIVSRPSTRASKAGHESVYGSDHGHVNAACCDCGRCQARRCFQYAKIERSDKAGQYRIGVDPAKGGDHYTVHSVKTK